MSGCPGMTTATRCTSHQQAWEAERNARRPQYGNAWERFAKAAIASYRLVHGDLCPGWRVGPHPIHPSQWTCDHDLGPMCRSCNSRKGALLDRPARRAQ